MAIQIRRRWLPNLNMPTNHLLDTRSSACLRRNERSNLFDLGLKAVELACYAFYFGIRPQAELDPVFKSGSRSSAAVDQLLGSLGIPSELLLALNELHDNQSRSSGVF